MSEVRTNGNAVVQERVAIDIVERVATVTLTRPEMSSTPEFPATLRVCRPEMFPAASW